MAAGAYIGYRLDLWLDSQGVLTLIFSLVALVMSVRLMIRKPGRDVSHDSDPPVQDEPG